MKLLRCRLLVGLLVAPMLSSCSPAFQLTKDAENGDVAAVRADLAKTPVDASVRGWTALDFAAANGRLTVVQVLLAAGAKVDARDSKNLTPLFQAAGREDNADGDYPGVVTALIAAGADVNAKDNYGETPLIYAAMTAGKQALVPILVQAGADVNASGKLGEAPLSWAAGNGDIPMMQALINAGANVDGSAGNVLSPLGYAADTGKLAAVKLLISAGAKPNGRRGDGEPLFTAAESDHLDIAQALLDAGADANAGRPTPLKIALEQGHSDVAALLVQRGGHT